MHRRVADEPIGAALARSAGMTLDQWLARRELVPPDSLRHRIAAVVATTPNAGAVPAPEAALDAALRLLDGLLSGVHASRAGALELLTADALMTYAFEATADAPERLEALGEQAMARIAAAAAGLPA